MAIGAPVRMRPESFRGAKAGGLPIDQASKFTLVVNLQTAKQLGISVTPTLPTLADELIE
jgi:putative tryptophan/tyrosine transport system substrate-binding protein